MNKFNIRDYVWLIYGDKICNLQVADILDKDPSNELRRHGISYNLYLDDKMFARITSIQEERLFKTKQELIASL